MFYLNSINLTLKNKLKSLFFIAIFIVGFLTSNQLNAQSTVLSYSGGDIVIGQNDLSTFVWPVTIINTNSSSILRVTLATDLVFSSLNQYFIIGSSNISFDGNNRQVSIDNITNYPGLFQNGAYGISGYNSVEIKNISIVTAGSSTLASYGGWLCQRYFSKGSILNSYSTGAIAGAHIGGLIGANSFDLNVSNCYTTGAISGYYAGGLIGVNSNNLIVSNCYSTGSISGSGAAGIVGRYSMNSTLTDCHSFGIISGNNAGGIYGYNAVLSVAINCYSTGSILGSYAGGIFGPNANSCQARSSFSLGSIGNYGGGVFGAYASNSVASTCFTIGSIDMHAGGIFGPDANICQADNCYTTGDVGSFGGGVFGEYTSAPIIINSYTTGLINNGGDVFIGANSSNSTIVNSIADNGAWSDTHANQVLSGSNSYNTGISQAWTSLNINTPYALTYFLTPNTTVTLPSNGSYSGGNNLNFTVNYNKNITVDVTGGTPRLELNVGGQIKYANYFSGSGTNALVFRYAVSNIDNGAITVNNLSYNGGSLVDSDGFNVALTLNGISSNSIIVDNVTIPITITSPSVNGFVSNTIPLSFNIPETILPGSLTMTLISNTFSITYLMVDRAVGNYSLNLNYQSDLTSTSPTYINFSSPAGVSSIPAGTYTLTMSYRDMLANPMTSTTISGLKFKYITAPPTIQTPTAGIKISNSFLLKSSYPDQVAIGSKLLIFSKNNTVVASVNLMDNNSDSINFDLHHIASSGGINIRSTAGMDSLPDGDYTVDLAYQDVVFNPAAHAITTFSKNTEPFIGVLSHQNNTVYGPFTETLTFNKPVGLYYSNHIIQNLINNAPTANLGSLTPTTDNKVLTFLVTPLQQGKIKLDAPFMGVVYDLYGNLSQVIAMDSIEYIDTTIRVNPTVTGVVALCQGDSTILTSSTAKTYLWSTGATTQSIVVKQSGTYNVKVTYDNFIRGASNDVVVSVNEYPAKPTITRDGNNNLVSSAGYGNIWYEGGVVLKDTANSIKPTKPGIYSVKASPLGCASAISANYYYVVTDVINLSNNEFIKLAPNPFTSQVNFDYAISGYSKMNMEIIDLSSGYKVESMQGLQPGISLNLGHLKAGTYVFIVSSKDKKLNYQFKMVKL